MKNILIVKMSSIGDVIHAKTGQCRIIDVGGRAEYWSPALDTLPAVNVGRFRYAA